MPDSREALLDRHLAGELSRSEQRALAQTALDDPELFDLLTTVAALKAVVLHGGPLEAFDGAPTDREVAPDQAAVAAKGGDRSAPRRFSPQFTVGVGLAAAVVLTFVMLPRRPERALPGPAADRPPPAALTDAAIRPRLLASRLGEPGDPPSLGMVSPGTAETSRPPQQEGTIVALAAGVASIDLGSLDGLSEGIELAVVRGTDPPVGRLTITATSLERARGRAAAGTLRLGDRIKTPPPVYLSAMAAQVQASIAAGDLATARRLAERAVAVAESSGVPPDSRRAAFAELGAVEYRVHAFAEAERHYRAAQTGLDAAPAASPAERAGILNELGAVLMAEGDYAKAAEALLAAQSAAGGMGAVAGQVANNLAVVTALRGDEAKAASLYTAALALVDGGQAPSEVDRRIIEKNLAALGNRDERK